MFEEVRIFDPKGRLKKIIKTKESSKRFWDKFYDSQGKQNSRIEIKPKKRVNFNLFDYPDEPRDLWEDHGL
jgi:hypothetical protein